MPTTRAFFGGDFDDCLYQCQAGFFGNLWELSSQWGASYSAVDCWQAEAR